MAERQQIVLPHHACTNIIHCSIILNLALGLLWDGTTILLTLCGITEHKVFIRVSSLMWSCWNLILPYNQVEKILWYQHPPQYGRWSRKSFRTLPHVKVWKFEHFLVQVDVVSTLCDTTYQMVQLIQTIHSTDLAIWNLTTYLHNSSGLSILISRWPFLMQKLS